MKLLITLVLLTTPLFCRADTTLARELAFDALMAIDYGQTRAIFNSHGRYVELNPLINRGNVGKYFFATTLLHAAVTYSLPEECQPAWQWGTIVVEGAVVGHNAYIGIGVRW